MAAEGMIPAEEFCVHHRIEISFLHSLRDYGLIEMRTEEADCFLSPDQLSEVEKLLRLHYDLRINMEGLDVVRHLLSRMEDLRNEATQLRNKLLFYEDPG